MEPKVVYDVFHEMPWGIVTASYLFVAALAAGTYLAVVLLNRAQKAEYGSVTRTGAVTAAVLGLLIPVLLVSELHQPLRFITVLFRLNPTSPMSWGAWIMTLFVIAAVLYAGLILKKDFQSARKVELPGAVLAVLIPLYTGLELSFAQTNPLWQSGMLPVFFLLATALGGVAVAVIVMKLSAGTTLATPEGAKTAGKEVSATSEGVAGGIMFSLGKLLSLLVVVNFLLIFIMLLTLSNATAEGAIIAGNILAGMPLGLLFWLGEMAVGIILPLFFLWYPRTAKTISGPFWASGCVLVGLYVQRIVEVIGGQSAIF
ncbi:MAG: polysulfide reductase NrfD [Firmicutes bacterium]|nr:polysulfide reductase NrfD [Bacillota bacterium]